MALGPPFPRDATDADIRANNKTCVEICFLANVPAPLRQLL